MGLRKRKDERKALKGSSSRKKKTKFSKPVFYNDAIKERWDPTKSFAKNYSSMGIVMSVNEMIHFVAKYVTSSVDKLKSKPLNPKLSRKYYSLNIGSSVYGSCRFNI